MIEVFKQKKSLLQQVKGLEIGDIQEYYEVVDFLIQAKIIKNIEKDFRYIYYSIHCGRMSYSELGIEYTYNYFDMTIENILEGEKDHEEFMKYVDYHKVCKDIENNGDYNDDYLSYVDVESLGQALVQEHGFAVEYYMIGENIFEFEKTNSDAMIDYYLDKDAVIYTYLTVKKYLEEHLSNPNKVLEACELTKNEFMNNMLEVA